MTHIIIYDSFQKVHILKIKITLRLQYLYCSVQNERFDCKVWRMKLTRVLCLSVMQTLRLVGIVD